MGRHRMIKKNKSGAIGLYTAILFEKYNHFSYHWNSYKREIFQKPPVFQIKGVTGDKTHSGIYLEKFLALNPVYCIIESS